MTDRYQKSMMDNLYWWGIPTLFRCPHEGPEGQDIALERQRLGDSQTAAIKQHQHRAVSGRDPITVILRLNLGDDLARGGFGQGARQFALIFRAARGENRRGIEIVALAPPAVEAFYRRQAPGQRPGGDPVIALGRHPRAHVARRDLFECAGRGHILAVVDLKAQKAAQLTRRSAVRQRLGVGAYL